MASNSFSLDISRWAEQTTADIATVVRKTALDMFSRIVLRTPVDTGRARSSWFVSIGQPSAEQTNGTDPSGAGTIARMEGIIGTAKLGDAIWMASSLPYIWRLETGWSKQSPNGMVGRTVSEFQSLFDRAAKSTKSFA